jgi:hypothetical protein
MGTDEPPPILPAPPVIMTTVIPPVLRGEIRRPGVVVAYRWWCALFALIYLSFAIHYFLVAAAKVDPPLGLWEELASSGDDVARTEIITSKRADAPSLAVATAAVALLYGAAAALSRKPRSWTLGIIVIGTTIFPFIITAALAVPLIVHWCKPEVKRYFE